MKFSLRKKKMKTKALSDVRTDSHPKQEPLDEGMLRKLFQKCPDVNFQEYQFGDPAQRVLLIFCSGMVDQETMDRLLQDRIHQFLNTLDPYDEMTYPLIQENLHLPNVQEVLLANDVISEVFSGKTLIYFETTGHLISTNLSKRPQRNPEESKMEVTIKGPRDNFIEDLTTNISLIRKRLKTNSMCVEFFEVGRRSKTTISLLYMDDIANPTLLENARKRIEAIDIDAIYGGNQLMELIEENGNLFPLHNYTGRPDFVVQSLLSGRIIILLDGVAYAIIIPSNILLQLKAAEDSEYTAIYSSLARFLRFLGVFIATLLPAFWVAVTGFHQNQIPFALLTTVIESRMGVPLPIPLEALLMLVLFELFREAGLRLPIAIGQTLSVVGGLIIGDAAIQAGLTSPVTVVVIAVSTIATFTLVNQSIIGAISILRFLSLVLASIFGLFGFCLSFFFILIYLASLHTFGYPYLEIATRASFSHFMKSLFRLPTNKYISRPQEFHPKDPTRKGSDKG
ncbi:spore germination protein [Thermoactinomyces sp. DSM 45892]|uniref:spore germination protein n=1 Tax=Thermoactinomyces sp. DSM 45892 TaxID=1882753 RepID=UPI0008943C7C|nr:spore germination protein [Thermoactinomyces sp. DSM 45892]SDY78310.1 GerA spore germination protein [Thermoactinomyces sp. DSM 45892]